jgi:hypothetical protein
VKKAPDDVENDVAREDRRPLRLIGPKICHAEFSCDVRVARSAVMPAVEGQEARLSILEAGGHRHIVLIHGEVNQGSPLERQQGLIRGCPIIAILPLGVAKGLSSKSILQL